jgi:hypothetical protein
VSDEARQGSTIRRAVAVVRDNSVAWFYYLEIALPILALAVLAISRDGFRAGWPHAVPKIASVALLGLILDAGFLEATSGSSADPSVPHAILIAGCSAALPRMLINSPAAGTARRAVPLRLAVVIAAIPVVHPVDLQQPRYDRLEDAHPLRAGAGDGTDATRGSCPRRVICRHSRPAGSVRPHDTGSSQHLHPARRAHLRAALYPQVLALAQRGFAAGCGDRPGFFDTPEAQAMALRRMRRQNVPVVLLDVDDSLENFRESFPVLTAYFDAAYEVAGTHTFDDRFGITLLVRSGARRAGRFEPLDWPCLR